MTYFLLMTVGNGGNDLTHNSSCVWFF